MLLQAPARLIANNAGVEGDVIVEKLMGQPWEQGYNAMDDRIENLLEAGIIDPAKVILRFLIPASMISNFCLSCLFKLCVQTRWSLPVLPPCALSPYAMY